ncbi:hypothetical protein N7467_010309 [Penicillium canescens]|nr:hypothetical protein N7467_010309 [Penicillium canescens]
MKIQFHRFSRRKSYETRSDEPQRTVHERRRGFESHASPFIDTEEQPSEQLGEKSSENVAQMIRSKAADSIINRHEDVSAIHLTLRDLEVQPAHPEDNDSEQQRSSELWAICQSAASLIDRLADSLEKG